jgi:Tol biopolymer transport system component
VTQASRTSTHELNLADPATGKNIALLKDGFFFWPMLSPDGRLIAFEGELPRAGIRNLYVMNTDGSNLRLLIPGRPFLKPIGKVAWSSDSKQIIYPVIDSSRQIAGFFRANIDGSNAQKIVFQGVDSFRAAWIAASPDGKQIAVVTQNLKDYSAQLYVVNADGTNAQPIIATTSAGQPIDELAWSPDSPKTLLSSGGTSSGNLTLGGTLNLSSPPVIGNTTPAAITGTTITATQYVGVSGGTF